MSNWPESPYLRENRLDLIGAAPYYARSFFGALAFMPRGCSWSQLSSKLIL